MVVAFPGGTFSEGRVILVAERVGGSISLGIAERIEDAAPAYAVK